MPANKLPHLPREEYEQLAQTLQEISESRKVPFDDGFARIDKTSRWVVWVLGGLVGATILVTLWWANLTTSRDSQEKTIIKLEADVAGLKLAAALLEGVTKGNRDERVIQIGGIQDRLRNLEAFIAKYGPVMDNIEFMRQHGISFKEDFEKINKFPAPNYSPPK